MVNVDAVLGGSLYVLELKVKLPLGDFNGNIPSQTNNKQGIYCDSNVFKAQASSICQDSVEVFKRHWGAQRLITETT